MYENPGGMAPALPTPMNVTKIETVIYSVLIPAANNNAINDIITI